MKDSIKKIILLLLSPLIVFLIGVVVVLAMFIAEDGLGVFKEFAEDLKKDTSTEQELVNIISNNSVIEIMNGKVLVTDSYDIDVNTNVSRNYLSWDYPTKIKITNENKYDKSRDYTLKKLIVDRKEIFLDGNKLYYENVDKVFDEEFFEDEYCYYYYITDTSMYAFRKEDVIEEFDARDISQKIFLVLKRDKTNNEKFWIEQHSWMPVDDKYDAFARDDEIVVRKFALEESGRHKIEMVYEYNAKKIIKEYDDACVMKLLPNEADINIKFKEVDGNIDIPEKGIDVLKNNNSFLLVNNRKEKFDEGETLTLVLDKGVINGGQKVSGNYTYRPEKLEKIVNNEYFWILKLIFVISVGTCGLSIILTRKPKAKNEYIRDCENVINPILAEALIDSKIGAKELIMTCILSGIKKGAVELIDNDTIKYCKSDCLNEREKVVMSMIFEDEKMVKIKRIKDIFMNDNTKTEVIYEKFSKLRNEILAELKSKEIYNKNSKTILRTMSFIATVCMFNIFPIMMCFSGLNSFLENNIVDVFYIINILIFLFTQRLNDAEDKGKLPKVDKNNRELAMGVPAFIIIFIAGISCLVQNIYALLIVIVVVILNFVTYRNSKKQIFTKKGKEEYQKAMMLKKYINDYSIMEKRDMEDVVLWDDYLIYATAFGIPNKITDKFAEGFFNTNINLQKINRLLGI